MYDLTQLEFRRYGSRVINVFVVTLTILHFYDIF